MKPSLLLIKMFRWRLAGAVGLIASGALLVSGVLLLIPIDVLDEFVASARDDVGLSLGFHIMYLSAVLAVLLTWGMKMHQRLHELPFPVTPRQMAYVPLAVAILLWALGLGCATGILITGSAAKGFALADWFQFWRHALRAVPITAAILLASLVAIGGRSQITFFLWYLPILPMHYRPESMPWARSVVEDYPLWWPALVIVSLFLFFAMPRHMAEMRRVFVARTVGPFTMAVRNWGAPIRLRTSSVLAQCCAGTYLLAVGVFFFGSSASPTERPGQGVLAVTFVFLPTACFVMGSVLMILAWPLQFALANSLKPGGLAIGIAMRVAAFEDSWGLTRRASGPTLDVCPQCHKHVFVWHRACPHCGQAQPVIRDIGPAPESQPFVRGRGWIARLAAGAGIPILIVFFAWSLGWSFVIARMLPTVLTLQADTVDTETLDKLDFFTSGPFTHDYVTLNLGQVAAGEERDKALKQIREILMAEPKPFGWVRELKKANGASGTVPAKFRIEAVRADDEHLVILALGLRWDRPEALGEGLAEYLVRQLGSEFPIELDPDYPYSRESPPYLECASFLDNRVHWVDPERPGRDVKSPRAKDAATDTDGVLRPQDAGVDMGAYER
jgi:ribosomal protein L32